MVFNADDEQWMQRALACAARAEAMGEVPVGAVVVRDNQLLGEGFNQPISLQDPSAHAEIIAMRAAAKSTNNYRLTDTTLYVTLEPCAMCVGAMVHARIARVIYAASDPKSGAVQGACQLAHDPHFNHCPEYQGGLAQAQAADLLRDFFKKRRAKS